MNNLNTTLPKILINETMDAKEAVFNAPAVCDMFQALEIGIKEHVDDNYVLKAGDQMTGNLGLIRNSELQFGTGQDDVNPALHSYLRSDTSRDWTIYPGAATQNSNPRLNIRAQHGLFIESPNQMEIYSPSLYFCGNNIWGNRPLTVETTNGNLNLRSGGTAPMNFDAGSFNMIGTSGTGRLVMQNGNIEFEAHTTISIRSVIAPVMISSGGATPIQLNNLNITRGGDAPTLHPIWTINNHPAVQISSTVSTTITTDNVAINLMNFQFSPGDYITIPDAGVFTGIAEFRPEGMTGSETRYFVERSTGVRREDTSLPFTYTVDTFGILPTAFATTASSSAIVLDATPTRNTLIFNSAAGGFARVIITSISSGTVLSDSGTITIGGNNSVRRNLPTKDFEVEDREIVDVGYVKELVNSAVTFRFEPIGG
jgi:hypothetical protein